MPRLQVNGYSVYISCGGEELEAYDVQNGDSTATCWIASEEGKRFIVEWEDTSAETHMLVDTYMDGRLVDSVAHSAQDTGFCDGVFEAGGRIRPFIFSPLVLTDDESLVCAGPNEELGTIRVTMTRGVGYVKLDKPYVGLECAVSEIGAMHEKSKKAGVHAVSFGAPEELEISEGCSTWTGEVENEPFATFTFCYRPLELLRANGIVPLRSPPPPPPPSQSLKGKKRASDSQAGGTSGAGQHAQKRMRVEAIKSEDALKVERADDDTDFSAVEDVDSLEAQLVLLQKRIADAKAAQKAGTTVKRETSPIRVHSFSSSEVIDLT